MRKAPRFLLCLTAFCLLLAAGAPAARADVLWEPRNSFYEDHYDACTYEDRSYTANGPEGFVTLWDAPNGLEDVRQYENGTELRIYWLYKDWGCASIWEDGGKEISGWVPMEQLLLVYDHISFEEEYGDRFKPYNGEFASYHGAAEQVNFFEYPGAKQVKDSRTLAEVQENDYTSDLFIDEQGRTWGYIGYLHGHIDGWFCLEEPDGTDFPLRQVEQEPGVPAQAPTLPLRALIPCLLVGAAVLVTGILLLPYLRRGKGKIKKS